MKRLLTLIAFVSVSLLSFAQTNRTIKISDKHIVRSKPNPSLTEHANYAPVSVQQRINQRRYPANFVSAIGTAVKIGETTYDSQTNCSMGSRIYVYPDGKVSAVWTYSTSNNITFPTRGTGYNHFDGTNWGAPPSAAIEGNLRTGWPAITPDGSGKELVFAHAANSPNSRKSINASVGSTSFTTTPVLQNQTDMIWHRAASSGSNVFVLNSPTDPSDTLTDATTGIVGPVRWSRSTDGGATWIEENMSNKLPGYTSALYHDGNADEYSVVTRDNVVAVGIMSVGRDIAFWKSIDHGATFTRTLIEPFPIASWKPYNQITDTNADGIGDTLQTVGTFAIGIDKSNNVNVVWTDVAVLDPDSADQGTAGTMSFSLGTDIFHWSESSPTKKIIGGMPDLNGDNNLTVGSNYSTNGGRYANVGVCTQPQIAFGDAGEIVVFYVAPSEDDTTDATLSPMSGQNFNDIYVVSSGDNAATWTDPVNVSNPDGSLTAFEDVFPSVYPDIINGNIHIMWQIDDEPGTCLDDDNPDDIRINDIVYLAIPKAEVLGVGNNSGKLQGISIKSYPNPSNGNVTFQLDLAKTMNVEISVSNLLGQKVMDVTNENLASGNHTITRDLSSLPNGIYFYTVSSNGKNITEKLVISK